jgi:hypothetical protein
VVKDQTLFFQPLQPQEVVAGEAVVHLEKQGVLLVVQATQM